MKRLVIPTAVILLALPAAATDMLSPNVRGRQAALGGLRGLGGFGGTVILSNSVGTGTFIGSAADPTSSVVPDENPQFSDGTDPNFGYYNIALSVRPNYLVSRAQKVRIGLRLDVDVDVIDTFGSTNTDAHDVQLRDIRLYASWAQFLKLEPAFLSWSGSFNLFFPTSREASISQRYLGASLGVTTYFRPARWFTFSWGIGARKNWNASEQKALNRSTFDNGLAPVIRAGDAADLGDQIATGVTNTEWSLSNSLGMTFVIPGGISLDVAWSYSQYFKYGTHALDEFSGPYAQAGKEITDRMVGTIEVGYGITSYLAVSLGTSTVQLPKQSDLSGFRFPFWDTTNGADNRQTFYLDLTGTF